MISSKAKDRMKRHLSSKKPSILVGKEGPSQQTMKEISRQLEKKRIVKVRILGCALRNDRTTMIASKIAEQMEATLIDVRGHTFILHKPRKKSGEKSP
jgi:putative YhbY family RNA-binding protein